MVPAEDPSWVGLKVSMKVHEDEADSESGMVHVPGVMENGPVTVGVLAVVGNTIRLEIQGRRAEIEVTKLVGGSNAYVRRPFLYTGVLYGIAGALLAWGILAGAVAVLSEPVATLARLYGSRYLLRGPTGEDIGILVAAGAVLGWVGAWISATRHLRSIEPRA